MAVAGDHERALVRVRGLAKSYGRFAAIRDVSFTIRSGEILGLIGPNGAGKTTLFECLAGVQPADAGAISFGEQPSDGPRQRSSVLFYVPDAIAPWPHQPVRWVLDYSLGFFGGRKEMYADVLRD